MPREDRTAGLFEALGADGVQRLVAAYGGLRLRVHTAPRPDSDQARTLGADTYRRLQARYAGEEIDIPTLAADKASRRRERVKHLADKGLTRAEIARAEGVTLRWVHQLLTND